MTLQLSILNFLIYEVNLIFFFISVPCLCWLRLCGYCDIKGVVGLVLYMGQPDRQARVINNILNSGHTVPTCLPHTTHHNSIQRCKNTAFLPHNTELYTLQWLIMMMMAVMITIIMMDKACRRNYQT
jgi:hypothetical protein